ncbi:altronate dehydratase [Caulobacter vibrioides]|uniref:UxaA family hydrolase n=1 Tax=Caulobacter vibrioides TaxID=155892 RepID=UPI000BB51400|nr:altronate dehydratase family protein [Caulobacter vibrioides]ATC24502.1 altronate dehydratase [Caulobacter vibrioides]AZH12653.1 altronate dehydratase [Caulobacter vibrioides]PLR15087.1 altronate dehydratase [Caulobacter vibrioides]
MTKNTPAPGESIHAVDPRDHVATALRDLACGESVSAHGEHFIVRADVPKGHKIATRVVRSGDDVLKYGWPIGRATADIAVGDHVHVHNVITRLEGVEGYAFAPLPPAGAPSADTRTFQGFRRKNGRAGTRNEIWVLCTVGCVANTARRIAEKANQRFAGRVDGVYAFPHPFGCSQLGDDLAHTRKLIAALASHPNAGGVLILGLGCENNQLKALLESAPDIDRERLKSFTTQMVEDELEDGLAAVEALVEIAEKDRREPVPVSELVVGLKCGGSDGFSGITANPLVGRIADKVAEAGGTPVLTEIPEIFGAENVLLQRAASREVFDAAVAVIDDFKRYFIEANQPIYENPSPGNIAGGITSLEEKSLGAVQKGGRAPLVEVLRYGETVGRHGLTLLEAPGNDAVSSTALTAAGATVILFTTGRGTPLGFPAPTLKIASNSGLAQRKPGWIDFDAGQVLEGVSMDVAAENLMDLVIETASGKTTKAELNGEREIALWKSGVTL